MTLKNQGCPNCGLQDYVESFEIAAVIYIYIYYHNYTLVGIIVNFTRAARVISVALCQNVWTPLLYSLQLDKEVPGALGLKGGASFRKKNFCPSLHYNTVISNELIHEYSFKISVHISIYT